MWNKIYRTHAGNINVEQKLTVFCYTDILIGSMYFTGHGAP